MNWFVYTENLSSIPIQGLPNPQIYVRAQNKGHAVSLIMKYMEYSKDWDTDYVDVKEVRENTNMCNFSDTTVIDLTNGGVIDVIKPNHFITKKRL